jgi:hypothetical protein
VWKVPRYYKTLDAGLAVQKGNKGCFLKEFIDICFHNLCNGVSKI